MKMIEQQPHFWELYQDLDRYYFSIAVDMSSVVSCWYIYFTEDQIKHYHIHGRLALDEIAKKIVEDTYRGDFSELEYREVSEIIKKQLQNAYKTWKSDSN